MLAALVFDHPGHEAIAERLGEGREALCLAEPVSLEPIGQHCKIVALETCPDGGKLRQDAMPVPAGSLSGSEGCDSTGASIDDSSIIESAKVAREAHTDGADAGAAAFLMRRVSPAPAATASPDCSRWR